MASISGKLAAWQMSERITRQREYARIWNLALENGRQRAAMFEIKHLAPSGRVWVVIMPGNSGFAMWLTRNHIANKNHQGQGVEYEIKYDGAAIQKEEFANGVVSVLKKERALVGLLFGINISLTQTGEILSNGK